MLRDWVTSLESANSGVIGKASVKILCVSYFKKVRLLKFSPAWKTIRLALLSWIENFSAFSENWTAFCIHDIGGTVQYYSNFFMKARSKGLNAFMMRIVCEVLAASARHIMNVFNHLQPAFMIEGASSNDLCIKRVGIKGSLHKKNWWPLMSKPRPI